MADLKACKKCGWSHYRIIPYGHFDSNRITYRIACPRCSYCTNAAEVVMYCKDCKYYDIQPDGRVMNWCKRRGFVMYDEDFCSRAEPKEVK